jgi:putative ABC transport system permease protein
MFSNYLKITLRNLIRFKGYALINIFGLSIGLACSLLIIQYLRYEWSYDKHHKNGDDLYRVSTIFRAGEREQMSGSTPSPLSAAIIKDFPEVLESTRLYKAPGVDKFIFKIEDQSFAEESGLFADSTLFRLLTYDFIAGDPVHALHEPFSVVIDRSLAHKFFGDTPAVGQAISIETSWGKDQYTVTGVFDKATYPSHIDADFYISSMSGAIGRRFHQIAEWGGNNLFFTFIRLRAGSSPEALEDKLPDWLDGYAADRLQQLGFSKVHFLEPVKDIYLYSPVNNMQLKHSPGVSYLYILGLIAAFVLFIACINFMNLATAKATMRTKEVGIRKVIGADRFALMAQFLSEAFIYTCFSIVIAYGLAYFALPTFNQLMASDININIFQGFDIILVLLGFIALTTFLAGGYPAAYISSFNPVQIFRGKTNSHLSAQQIRRILVGFQFLVSIGLIQGALIIQQQLKYIKNKDLGFNKEEKIIIPHHSESSLSHFDTYREQMLTYPGISQVGGTSAYPGGTNMEDMIMFGKGQTPEEGMHSMLAFTDPEFMELMDFELINGRIFSRESIGDTSTTVVINEKLAKGLGYTPSTAVGQRMYFDWGQERSSFKIIGVIKNFHASTLHNEMEGYAFFWDNSEVHRFMVANVQMDDIDRTLKEMQSMWASINPEAPFEFYFLDEQLQQNYLSEQRLGGLVSWGTGLAIFISFLGLFGLATFTVERRAREISIRKVLGASITNIVGLLSTDFVRLIAVAFLLASPLSWYIMSNWLRSFEYHVDMPWWAFLLAGIISCTVALTAIGWQSLKAAVANPVDALSRE